MSFATTPRMDLVLQNNVSNASMQEIGAIERMTGSNRSLGSALQFVAMLQSNSITELQDENTTVVNNTVVILIGGKPTDTALIPSAVSNLTRLVLLVTLRYKCCNGQRVMLCLECCSRYLWINPNVFSFFSPTPNNLYTAHAQWYVGT